MIIKPGSIIEVKYSVLSFLNKFWGLIQSVYLSEKVECNGEERCVTRMMGSLRSKIMVAVNG
jgi:hypothetical protein